VAVRLVLSLSRATVRAALATLRREHGAVLSNRVVRMIEACADPSREAQFPAGRRADQLWMPDLPTRPWYESHELEWASRLEASAQEISAECRAVTRSVGDLEYYLGDDEDARAAPPGADGLLPPASGWKAFFLRRSGIWRRDNCALCPVTTAALRGLPLSAGDVMFSVLAPRSKIVPHHGLHNLDLTCHLGIDIPNDCGLEVGEESRSWKPGRLSIFDDTYRHWAWNRSDHPRRVLLFDFWNPDLSAVEHTQLKRALPLLFAPSARATNVTAQ
jgi:aspartate beta-hydroxylase